MRIRHSLDLDEKIPIDPEKAILGVRENCARLKLDGISIAWEEFGEGVPVVCLHGAGHGARDFKLLQSESPAGCRLFLFDWPGHGRSGIDARSFTVERCTSLLAGFLHALDLRNPILLGSEFGAAVAVSFATQHPAQVRGLVLVQPDGLLHSSALRRAHPGREKLLGHTRSLLTRSHGKPAEQERLCVESLEERHALQRNQASLSVLALEESLRAAMASELCPMLVALASRNRDYPLRPFLKFLDPHLSVTPIDQPGRPKLAIFPGRHTPLWEDPGRMAQVLSGFAASTLPMDEHAHSWTLAAADWPARGMNQWLCTHPRCRAALTLPVDENPNRHLLRH